MTTVWRTWKDSQSFGWLTSGSLWITWDWNSKEWTSSECFFVRSHWIWSHWKNRDTYSTISSSKVTRPSAFLQAKLYPEYSFKKFDSKSPFGVSVFANLEFATYRDTNRNVRIYVFKDSYATTIANFRLATNVYTVKEVDAFFEKTFFLNTVKKNDGMVRFVILEKTWVYGLEMPKWQYSKIKTYLQSK